MSINTLQPGAFTRPTPLPGENPHLAAGFPTEIELRIPATMEGPKRTLTGSGRLWITYSRVIYVSNDSPAGGPATSDPSAPSYAASTSSGSIPTTLESLIVPYETTMTCTYHLPTFSSNHLLLAFQPYVAPDSPATLPSPGRGGKYEAKMVVGDGQSHAVWKRIEAHLEKWRDKTRDDETLPAYSAK